MPHNEQPAAYQDLAELEQHITGPEDAAQVEAWRNEIDQKRAEAVKMLGNSALPHELHVDADGVVLTKSDKQQDSKDTGAYENGRRA